MKEKKRRKKTAVEKNPENICYFYLQESFWILITPSKRHWSPCKTIFWPVTFLIHSLYWEMRREKEIEMRRVFCEQLNPAVLMPSPARSDSPVNFCSIDCPRNKQDQLMLHVGCEWWLFVGPYLTAGCPDCLPWGLKIGSWSFRRAQVYLPKDSWGQGDTKGGFMEAKPARLVMGRQGKAREYPAAFKPLRHFMLPTANSRHLCCHSKWSS